MAGLSERLLAGKLSLLLGAHVLAITAGYFAAFLPVDLAYYMRGTGGAMPCRQTADNR
jgi:hypothetical protein